MEEHIPNEREIINDAPPIVPNEIELLSNPRRRIEKVPPFIRQKEDSKSYYDPVFVSFGPYHHNKEELQIAESFKPKCLQLFAEGGGHDLRFYFIRVLEMIPDVRSCYVDGSTDEYDDNVFATMMLYDASFIINYIYMKVKTEMYRAFAGHLGELGIKLIYHDMWLLENQIPLWFLKNLIHLRFGEDVGEEMLNKYLSFSVSGVFKKTRESNENEEEPVHLLELLRRLHVADFRKGKELNHHRTIIERLSLQSPEIGRACRLRRISLKLDWLWTREMVSEEFDVKKYYHSFRSATDLKAKGIYLKPSDTYSCRDVRFKSSNFYAKLQVPAMHISVNAKVILLNIVAFELCPNSNTNIAVPSYINFFKKLIQSPEDIKELREKKIIYDELGSDEEVLQLYKGIDTYGVDNKLMFSDVRDKIQEHYNSKAKTWLAELSYTYFESPWSVIALLAAIVLLFATLVQSYFSVYPSSNK